MPPALGGWDLTALVNAAEATSTTAERHLWLVRLMEWLRHAPPAASPASSAPALLPDTDDEQPTPRPVLRLKHLLNQIERQDELRQRVQALRAGFWRDIDAASLLADFGFGARVSFAGELWTRVQAHVLPGTPATTELAALRDAAFLRAVLGTARRAPDSVMPHLEQHGVSVNIVYDLDQLNGRLARIERLVDSLLAPDDASALTEGRHLLVELLGVLREQRGLRALFSQHYSLLARQVAERSAETGKHYIARDRAEYRDMLRRAVGGGVVVAGTTFAKFAIVLLGLSAFWGGFWAGAMYAASFVLIMLLHWTLATKQPAMTAAAMAATLPAGSAATDEEVAAFVDRVEQLIRTQVAGVVGNLAAVVPVVLALQWLSTALLGRGILTAADADYVLHSLSLLGPTVLFAAFTGVLLFISSLVAGWAENWFVFHRLDSAIAWNPRIVATLGSARATRWARWWRVNVFGLAGNVSLGPAPWADRCWPVPRSGGAWRALRRSACSTSASASTWRSKWHCGRAGCRCGTADGSPRPCAGACGARPGPSSGRPGTDSASSALQQEALHARGGHAGVQQRMHGEPLSMKCAHVWMGGADALAAKSSA